MRGLEGDTGSEEVMGIERKRGASASEGSGRRQGSGSEGLDARDAHRGSGGCREKRK